MEGMVWLDCDRHGLARIGYFPRLRFVLGLTLACNQILFVLYCIDRSEWPWKRDGGHIEDLVDQEGSVELCVVHGGYRMTADGVGDRDWLG